MPYLHRSVLFSAALAALIVIATAENCWAAAASNGVVEALQKKYLVTETTPDHEQVTKDGVTMSLKCAGVYSLPTSNLIVPDNKVADGKIQPPSMFARMTWTNMGSHVLQTGDKVYITKIDKKGESGDELLRFTILTVDPLNVNGQDAQRKYYATVSFKFKKGYLDDSSPEDVEKIIEAVLAPDAGDSPVENNSAAAQPEDHLGPPSQRAPAPAASSPAPAPAGPPPIISIGESSTEVLQAMGMPLQMIDLGKKKTYVYKNMKIIFIDDKVSDVQ